MIDELIELYRNFGSAYWAEHGDAASAPVSSSDPSAVYNEMIDFIYDHADEFRLAVNSLDGTRYARLIEPLLHDMNRIEAHFYIAKPCRFRLRLV